MEQQCFSSLKNLKKLLLNFWKILQTSYKNGNEKIVNLLKQFWEWIFKTCDINMVRYWQWHKGWIFASQSNKIYNKTNRINYSDAYSLVTGDIAVTGCNANTKLAFKNCAPFEKCSAEIDGALADEVDFLNITMQFNEYSDNYSDTSGSWWQFKRD